MIRNLREIILNRIAEIIKGNDYDEIYATGKTLVCNCTLGLPSITCTYEYKSNI